MRISFNPVMLSRNRIIVIVSVILLLACFPLKSRSQAGNENGFTLHYAQADQLITRTLDSLKILLAVMTLDPDMTEVQRARIDIMRSKAQVLDDMVHVSPAFNLISRDTAAQPASLLDEAQWLILQSRPDEGIPLILKFLERDALPLDSITYAGIYLTEAYRQKQEYHKGIGMIYELLGNPGISVGNRAFAMNRLAALYNEIPSIEGNKSDSVVKYSRLCIDIAGKNRLTEYLAASQNELGNNFWQRRILDSALYYISKATGNFLKIKKYPQVINTYLNTARVYMSMKDPAKAKEILLKALELGGIEKNRNLFMYVYDYLALTCNDLGEYQHAYEYSKLSRMLRNQFYNDRIRRQINEMSAKYELNLKEAKIREEEGKIKTYRLQVKYLIIIALISTVLLILSIVWFRFKRQAYTKMVQQNLKAMRLEKQLEDNLIRLTDNDIRDQAGSTNQHAELALRFEKFLAEEKPYLSDEVSLEEFCKKLNTNRTYLSKLINDRYHMGFYDLLIEYRIRAALEYLNNPKYAHFSVEGIGGMVGFKSNSNFHKRFKSLVGMTPNQFRERALKSKQETGQ